MQQDIVDGIVETVCEAAAEDLEEPVDHSSIQTTSKPLPVIESCSIPHPKADVYFVLDGSFSTRLSGWKEIIEFVKGFVKINEAQGGNMNYGLLQYSDRVEPIVRLSDETGNKETSDFLQVLDGIDYHGGFSTLTGTAMKHVRDIEFKEEFGDRPDAPNIMIVMTDGKSKDKGDNTVQKIGELLRNEASITVIAVGIKKAKHSDLVGMATREDLVHEAKSFTGLDQFFPSMFAEICIDVIGGQTVAVTTTTTTTTTTPKPKFHLPVELRHADCNALVENYCTINADIGIFIDAYQNLRGVDNPWQMYLAKQLISQFSMIGDNGETDGARITLNPVSRRYTSMTATFDESRSSNRGELCQFTNSFKGKRKSPSHNKEYRGDHFFEGMYPIMSELYFDSTPSDRKRVMIIIKHLTDNVELKYSDSDRSSSYWQGHPAEPDVFVIAVGDPQNKVKYSPQLDRLLRLAGSPSRLLFLEHYSLEEVGAIIPIIRQRVCSLNSLPPFIPPPTPVTEGTQCTDKDNVENAWERPVCCAQADIFFGFQMTKNSTNNYDSLR